MYIYIDAYIYIYCYICIIYLYIILFFENIETLAAVHPFCFTILHRNMVFLGFSSQLSTFRNSLGTKSCWSKCRNSSCEMPTVAPCWSGSRNTPGFSWMRFLLDLSLVGSRGWFNLVPCTWRNHEIWVYNSIMSSWLVLIQRNWV